MKKIVPFNTDVREITAISLEHNIEIDSDVISGEFYISGEYKMTDGQLEREEFNFELPFDIALGSNYDIDSLLVDIDDFRYELVERNKLKVNIDLYIDGEIIEKPIITEPVIVDDIIDVSTSFDEFPRAGENPLLESDGNNLNTEDEEKICKDSPRCLSPEEPESIKKVNNESLTYEKYTESEYAENKSKEYDKNNDNNQINDYPEIDEPIQMPITENLDLLDEMLESNKEKIMKEQTINEKSINIDTDIETNNQEVNIFTGFDEEERYVTYRVYRVMEGDTVDKILEKYNITKEELSKYNNLEDIKPGDKLIIPANDK